MASRRQALLYTLCAGISLHTLPITSDVDEQPGAAERPCTWDAPPAARAEYQRSSTPSWPRSRGFPRVVLQWRLLKENALFQLARSATSSARSTTTSRHGRGRAPPGVRALRITGQRMRDSGWSRGRGGSTQGIAECWWRAHGGRLTHEEAAAASGRPTATASYPDRPNLEQYKAPSPAGGGGRRLRAKDRSRSPCSSLENGSDHAHRTSRHRHLRRAVVRHGPAQRPAHRLPALDRLEDRRSRRRTRSVVGGRAIVANRQPVRSVTWTASAPHRQCNNSFVFRAWAGADGERRARRCRTACSRGRQGLAAMVTPRTSRVRRLPQLARIRDCSSPCRRDDPPGRDGSHADRDPRALDKTVERAMWSRRPALRFEP